MEKEEFDYGAFVKHKAPEVTEHLETLDVAAPIETTEHLQFQERVRKVKQLELQRAKLEQDKKRARILAVKKAQAKKEMETSAATTTEQSADDTVIQPENQNSSSVVFDWEVPFMNDGTEPKIKTKKAKKEKKSKKSKTEKVSESNKIAEAYNSTPAAASKKTKKSKHEKNDLFIAKPKFSIGAKLIIIISLLMVVSLLGLTSVVSYFISDDTRVKAEENNMTINNRSASDADNRIGTIVSNVGMFLDLLDVNSGNLAETQKYVTTFFDRNKDIIAVYLPGSSRIFVNNPFAIANEITSSFLTSYVESEEEALKKAADGVFDIENASPFFQFPVLAMFYPLDYSSEDTSVVVIYSAENLANSFSAGSVNQSFLVNADGEVLVHPDLSYMLTAADVSNSPIVLQILSDNQPSEQFYYKDADGVEFIGAYNRLNNGSCSVITTVKTEVVLEAVNKTTLRNIYLTIATLSFAIMIIWFFAKSLSVPLRELTAVTNEINQGNFESEVFDELKINRRDEIGVLVSSTRNEQQILNTFSHLTNKAVTKAVIRKEIDFDAHLKDITIFFSDIRGFTAISDGFSKRFGEKSAGEIISFLNDYMSRMVNCITITGGNVDKFEGDAIMACWGVLRNDSLDFEMLPDSDPEKAVLAQNHAEHVKEDAINAIRAVVAMRYALMKYNKDAALFTEEHKNEAMAQYKPHIRIGCGLNSGRATVGFMGSYDKMEFTSIGDSVNLASRTEASNKPCGTDGLITEDTYNLLKMDYIRCKENNFTLKPENEAYEVVVEEIPVAFEVKGKGKQHFYGIVNMPKFDIEEFFKTTDPDFQCDPDCSLCLGPNGPKNLNEVRALLGIPIPDFSGVNLDEEENKTKISLS